MRDSHGNFLKAESFAKFFYSVFTTDDNTFHLHGFARCTNTKMNLPVFNSDEVHDAIKALKNSNSCGPDGISIKFLKLS